MRNILILLLMLTFLSNCKESNQKENVEPQIESKDETVIEKTIEHKQPEKFGISGEGIELRKGPGTNYEKVVNTKTSEILKKTIYANVDYTVKVIEIETDGSWSKIKVVEPSYLSNRQGWIPTKHIIKKEKMEKLKIPLYSKVDELRTELSKNGIGELGSWKKDELGWYSFTDYHSFGNSSSVNGMQNNIAYYINGRQKDNANEVKIVLNINNDNESKTALELLNTISQKTIKSLDLEMPKGLSQNILNQKPNEFENDVYRISLELDKSKIDTWNLIIYSK
ncbi:MAG: hypothetical protein KDC52_16285 [Ignavibacteriae bacterium]|nr:hypothetical protein [Ignavibacteriota bacterium]